MIARIPVGWKGDVRRESSACNDFLVCARDEASERESSTLSRDSFVLPACPDFACRFRDGEKERAES
jgi:hypothetical protein